MKDKPNDQRLLDDLLSQAMPEEEADFRQLWALTGSMPEPGTIDRDAEAQVWTALHTLIHLPAQEPAEVRRPLRRIVRIPAWMALAATLLIGAVGMGWWLQPVARTAPLGERLTVLLPDGSHVELNSGATLRHGRRFGEIRLVHLEGEAYFDIVKDSRPFRVETFNAQVEVLGTRFNVKAWPGGLAPATTVTLESGRVALRALARPDQAVEMAPGEMRSVGPEAAPGPPLEGAVGAAVAWRQGALIYQDEWLGVVLEDLERRFGMQLVLEVPALLRRRVNFSNHNPSDAEDVIRALCATYGLKYRPTTIGYVLYDPNPN